VKPTADPDQIGLDPRQLARLDAHFARYVDDGRLAGWQIGVGRNGEIGHTSTYGVLDLDSGAPVRDDTLWRIYSMTKPITSVAAMMLWEEGAFELTDEISRWIPAFASTRVFDRGSAAAPVTVPAVEPIRIWHLLSHTSGLTYGHMNVTPVDAMYRAAGFDMATITDGDLAEVCDRWAALPLLFQPGTGWGYGVSTDVLGRIVEIISGQSLADFCQQRIFEPLGMTSCHWWLAGADDLERLATLHVPAPGTGRAVRWPMVDEKARHKPGFFAGGAGLICTASDYQRFLQMLANGGELDGARLLGPRTVSYMTRNHLPGGADIDAVNAGGFAETIFEGVGFGLGFAVVRDPIPARYPTSPGTYYWGGAASTAFFIDPVEDLIVTFYTQLMPSAQYSIRPQLRQLVYAALR
jgi:CubicO group peptidase (beta-lactamase class C family)